jgi:anti-sigma B factor antagonist
MITDGESTVQRMRERLAELIADGHFHLIVDLQGVDFLDSTGLGVPVGGLKRVYPHDGSFQLVCTQERILKVFRITGLINVFSIHSSVQGATNPDRMTGRTGRTRSNNCTPSVP